MIEVVTKAIDFETEEDTADKVIIVKDLENIEKIDVKYAVVDLMGHLTIEFSKFVTRNITSTAANST